MKLFHYTTLLTSIFLLVILMFSRSSFAASYGFNGATFSDVTSACNAAMQMEWAGYTSMQITSANPTTGICLGTANHPLGGATVYNYSSNVSVLDTSCPSGVPLTANGCNAMRSAAAQAAYDAALATHNGNVSAAFAASDAVTAHASITDPAMQAALGASAAAAYVGAVGNGFPLDAADVATAAGNAVAQAAGLGATASQSSQIADKIAGDMVTGLGNAGYVKAANLAAGVLGAGAIAIATVGGSPLAGALALSASVHAGILGSALDSSVAAQVTAAQVAAANAIKSGATPLQVKIVTKSSVAAVAAAPASAPSSLSPAAQAALNAIISNPSGFVATPDNIPTAKQQTAANAANSAALSVANNNPAAAQSVLDSAAQAAALASLNGSSAAAADAAAQAAAAATLAGQSPQAAAIAGSTAAAAVGAGSTAAAAVGAGQAAGTAATGQGASMAKTEGLLTDIRQLLGYGDTTDYSPYVSKASSAETTLKDSINSSLTDIKNQEAIDEASVDSWFTLTLPTAACSPFSGSLAGRTVSINLCQYTEHLRELLTWLLYIFGALSVYSVVFQPKS